MFDGFVRVAAATPAIKVADCAWNSEQIVHLVRQADKNHVSLLVFPELCLTGYTCSDLFLSDVLQKGAIRALHHLRQATADLEPVCIVGLPLAVGSALYNVAAVLHRGRLLGLIPKQQIPNYAEFYEARHFSPAPPSCSGPATVRLLDEDIPFGTDLLFASSTLPDFIIGVEICEDLWVPRSPSIAKAQAGATVIVNLSASDETITKATYRRLLVRSHSARLICTYVYADAGEGESTTDLVFAGHNLLYENGRRLAESELFSTGLVYADTDVRMLAQERRRQNTFPGESATAETVFRRIPFANRLVQLDLNRDIPALPFVPADRDDLAERCEEILSLQVHGLKKRLAHTGCRSAVVGLSGGLDSTLAFQVTVRAFDALCLDRAGIQAITMPGFGTTDRTYQNACALAASQQVTLREIQISQAVLGHFADIGHDPTVQDITYENAQARERTQILMDIANQTGGLVIGTGDLSELALGWATYNGDHMSMYGVNASVPKTLVRHLVRYAAGQSEPDLQRILLDIVDTPVSPELLPPQNGEIAQKTEQLVGPYELHDFFLYYLVRFGFEPGKILRLALHAFHEQYDGETVKRWLIVFLKRFFAQQFKRSCLPDGPKIGSVTLSPRGDWRMPSDASVALWLDQLENAEKTPF